VRVVAPAIELDSAVVVVGWVIQEGSTESEWEIASEAAGHHLGSAFPGEGGNVVLAGHHNIEGKVFRRVVDLKPGDEVTLETADGASHTYVVEENLILPEAGASDEERLANAAYIAPTDDERLTLVTCWPYWTNTHRVVVIARPAP